MVRTKDGVRFSKIAPAGFRILGAIEKASRILSLDLTITSATDGAHSGPNDPHRRGEAYDVRTHGFTEEQKQSILATVMTDLGWEQFFGFLESPKTQNEHLHLQIKKGATFP